MTAPLEAPAPRSPGGGHSDPRPIAVEAVTTWGGRRDFLRVPYAVHSGDPHWVPPLLLERHLHLSRRNPFFRHAEARLFVAYRDGAPVGRLTAQIDRLHLERYRDATGFFGMLDAIDDPRVFAALATAAETWLAEHGMERVRGPLSFSINDEVGALVDGFDRPPMFMMPHGQPYYDARLRELGYEKAKDVVAYLLDAGGERPPIMSALLRRARNDRIRTRPIDLGRLREEIAIIEDLFNDAWENNWGYVRWTREELDDLGSSLKLFVPAELVQIAEIEGEPAAFIVVVPNLNEAIRDLGGHLFPLGWLKLLRRMRKLTSARVPLMGMRRKHQRSATGMALVFHLLEAVRGPLLERGMRNVELSWTLEDNRPMRHIKERIGARVYKTFRIYEKALRSQGPTARE
jgi:hypothetical protein